MCMSARVCIHENPHAVWLASIHADITTLLCPLIPSFPFFFWAAWASGNDALKSEITALIQIRLLTDFLCSQKHSKVSFELPEGFSVTAEKWQQQGMFRVTRNLSGYSRKPCRRAAPPKSGNLYILKRGYRFIPHILFTCFLEKQFIPFWLVSAITLLPKEPVRKEPLLSPSL